MPLDLCLSQYSFNPISFSFIKGGDQGRHVQQPDSHNRLFGDVNRQQTPAKNHQKSTISIGSVENGNKTKTNGHTNGNGHALNGNGTKSNGDVTDHIGANGNGHSNGGKYENGHSNGVSSKGNKLNLNPKLFLNLNQFSLSCSLFKIISP